MKKFLFTFIFIFVSSISFAEGLSGIFGIEFGKSSTEVKSAMKEKGWKTSKTENTELRFKKSKGTYASLIVDEISFYFFEDRLYEITVSFPFSTKTEDIAAAVNGIQEACSLTFVGNDENKYGGSDVLTYTYTDPQMNIFRLNVLIYKSMSSSFFELIDFNISNEKKEADNKLKEEETARKNKTISSDL